MKELTTFLIIIFAVIMLIGCQGGSPEKDIELLDEERHYNVESFNLDIDVDFMQFYLFLHKEQLHLLMCEVDEETLNTFIHLLTMDADGTNIREIYRLVLNEEVDFFYILGFEKHDDSYITLVTTDSVILPPYTREDFFSGFCAS